MKDELRRVLDPGDDGRAFADAVLLRASGALHRRRRAAEAEAGAFDWLAAWARPWIITVVLTLAMAAAILPLLPTNGDAAPEPAEAALLAVPQAEDMLVVTIGH